MATLPEDEKVAEACAVVIDAATKGIDWITRNGDTARDQAAIKDLARIAYASRRLERAARRKMCVGVYGPSQSGKSYLISALARSGTERLIANFNGELIDFIKDINPEGGRESTGLVTRFTIDRPEGLPSGSPVQLRLLSQTDIVKIIGNSYFADCKQSSLADPEASDIGAKLDALAKEAGPPVDALNEDDVLDCQEYFEKYFDNSSRLSVLRKTYWNRAASLAPRLKPEARGRLFGLIWGEVAPFTELFVQLLKALKALDFQSDVFAGTNALVPKRRSIIDVALLGPIGRDDPDALRVVTRNGTGIDLPRSIAAGLTAEIIVVMERRPYAFFDHTDLLDFPGARSREEIRDIDAQLAKPDGLKDFFLRGKVSYLFERYTANLELNSMLLCIGPSNQEVRGLPEIVRNWIDATHGATPEERAKKSVSLFFVLTQFDKEFERKADWQDTLSTRWSTRLFSSLLDFFGKYHAWPKEWTPGKAFDNSFCLRNPNIEQAALFDYADGKELRPRPDMTDYVTTLGDNFVANEDVKRHFADPRAAWQAVMELNDGGVQRLAKAVAPVCNPELKRTQLRALAMSEARKVATRLRPFFRSNDLAEERRKQTRMAEGIARRLVGCASAQRFGLLIDTLQIDDQDLHDIYFALEVAPPPAEGSDDDAGAQPALMIGQAVGDEDLLASLGLSPEPPPEDEAAPANKLGANGKSRKPALIDEVDRYVIAIQQFWNEHIMARSSDAALRKLFGLSETEFPHFAQELVRGATRLNLWECMAADIRSARAFHAAGRDSSVWRQAATASLALNNYIDYLGFGTADNPKERPRVVVGAQERTVFAPRSAVGDYPTIGEAPSTYDRNFYLDWIKCFIQLVGDNVDGGAASGFNAAENEALGKILAAVGP